MTSPCPQLKARCEELKLDWSTLSLENLLKEKQALRTQISEKQRHCLELQVGAGAAGLSGLQGGAVGQPLELSCAQGQGVRCGVAGTVWTSLSLTLKGEQWA